MSGTSDHNLLTTRVVFEILIDGVWTKRDFAYDNLGPDTEEDRQAAYDNLVAVITDRFGGAQNVRVVG